MATLKRKRKVAKAAAVKETRKRKRARRKQAPPPVVKRPPGRPPEDLDPLALERVLEAARSTAPFTVWCRQRGNPSYSTVCEWKAKDPVFAERFARARAESEEAMLDEALREGREERISVRVETEVVLVDGIPLLGEDGEPVLRTREVREDNVARSKAAIDAILKVLARRNPQKTKLEHSGSLATSVNGSLQVQVVTGVPDEAEDELDGPQVDTGLPR